MNIKATLTKKFSTVFSDVVYDVTVGFHVYKRFIIIIIGNFPNSFFAISLGHFTFSNGFGMPDDFYNLQWIFLH